MVGLGARLGWIWEIWLVILFAHIWGVLGEEKTCRIRSPPIKLKGKKAIFEGGVTSNSNPIYETQ